ncbi:hypothetical protein PBI_GAIA_122 [Mycobacterium phage Gaia]|uniref:HNH endonuclease n=1 Tax=Mycobacterium phage Gaia TaxID=1486472 RepID=A0A068F4P3_9CAUD|nr:hypothetical protein VC46_gp111 [Mycobacterium phage Gaia]AID58941.1 hypothetical protein PBI_GAIA_122 [Mycobacterium phage Gaia]AYR00059.1 HNH endonuclease [Mycobacterium phage Nebkiss]
MSVDPDDVVPKFGKDDNLEAKADRLLSKGVGKNKRSTQRDKEKMLHEAGLLEVDDLDAYDPTNYWSTQDAPNGEILMSPNSVVKVTPSIGSDVGDGNVRARNLKLSRRRALMHHVEDEDDWGGDREFIPLLGVNEGRRKTCTKCGRSKRVEFFSSDSRNVDGVRSWCRLCDKAEAKARYARKKR